jgi:hypothetical protein
VFGVVVEGVAHLDNRAKTALRFREIGVDVVLVFAAKGAVLHKFLLLAETLDIDFVHLGERRRHVGRRRGIAAQFLQRRQDLIVPALGAAQIQLFGLGGHALGADQVFVKAGIETADVAQRPGDVGVARLPVSIAVEQGHLADLLVEHRGDGGIEDGVVGDDLLGGIAAGFGRTIEGLVDGLAQRCEFDVQGIHAAGQSGAILKRAGQRHLDLIHLFAGGIGLLAVLVVEFRAQARVHRGGPEHDVGGEPALGVHIARNVSHHPDDLQPALRDGDLVHRLVFHGGDIDGKTAADSGKRDD